MRGLAGGQRGAPHRERAIEKSCCRIRLDNDASSRHVEEMSATRCTIGPTLCHEIHLIPVNEPPGLFGECGQHDDVRAGAEQGCDARHELDAHACCLGLVRATRESAHVHAKRRAK